MTRAATESAGIDPIPPGGRLLHIGPHKTGTTAIQRALHAGRQTLREQHDVLYPRGPSQIRAAVAVTGAHGLVGSPKASIGSWNRLVRQVADADVTRTVISSEFFDMADDETAARVVRELGGDSVHVLITARPVSKLVASAWQQAVRARQRLSYERWLEQLFGECKPRSTKNFWLRHRLDLLAARWAEAAGTDRVTVLVVDESNPSFLLHSFEQLLALPADTLVVPKGSSNRSLSYAETEVVRALNHVYRRQGWSPEMYARFVRDGVVDYLQHARRPSRSEPKIVTPQWALDRSAEVGAEIVAGLEASGVRVIGNLPSLAARATAVAGEQPEVPRWAIGIATKAAIGVMTNTGFSELQRPVLAHRRLRASGLVPASELRSSELLHIVGKRVRRRIRRFRKRRLSA